MAKKKRRFPWTRGRRQKAVGPRIEAERAALISLNYQINHIFLPPKLPQAVFANAVLERELVETIQAALTQFRACFDDVSQASKLDRCIRMLRCMLDTRTEKGMLNKDALGRQMTSLEDHDCLAVHIEAQNAGLLMARMGQDIHFESMEILALDSAVIACEGRLQRCFPARAVALPKSLVDDSTFRRPFLDVISKLDSKKSSEPLSTVDPRLVNEMMMGVLRALGSVIDDVPYICKHTREESLRSRLDGSSRAWRRSPQWLLIRVVLQLTLDREGSPEASSSENKSPDASSEHKPQSLYKAFMIFLLSFVLERAVQARVSHDLLFVMKAKICRRILKMEPADGEPWLRFARDVLNRVDTVLARKWESIQSRERHAMELSALPTLDFDQDTALSLNALRPHLAWISGRREMEDPRDNRIQGLAFQKLRDDQVPSGVFRHNKEIAFFELADFEHWVESHIETYNPPDAAPPPAARKRRGKRKGTMDTMQGRNRDAWKAGCGTFKTEFEKSTIDETINMKEEEVWSRVVDNDSARAFWDETKTAGAFPPPSSATPPPAAARLCQRCKTLPVSEHDLELFVQPAALAQSSKQCELCSMLYRALSPPGAVHPARPIRLRREGSNLLADEHDRPVLRMCTSPQWTGDDVVQVAPPALLERSSDAYFELLAKWLRDCEDEHENHGCLGKSRPALPTRVIDVGSAGKEQPSRVRLVCSWKWSRGEYVALSHRWGTLTRENLENCTVKSNLAERCRGIKFAELGKTFQDAITVTRRLGLRYLWIDSLCIVQDDPDDWKREAGRMQDVFHQAYVTIAATAAEDAQAGFLGPRPPSRYVTVQTSHGAPVYFCESVDDFRGDVELAGLNQRGWVLQERALSRRTIHFGNNQAYWECGRGICCESLAQLSNPKARFLGDPQFPSLMARESQYKRHRAFQSTFQLYSRLALTYPTDRPIAVAGVESRLADKLYSSVVFGVFGAHFYLHRSLLWRRADEDKLLRPIDVDVPSWSWMAYEGAIDYLDIRVGKVDWNTDINMTDCQLVAPIMDFALGEMLRDVHRLVFDCRRTAHVRDLKCVVVGRQGLPNGEDDETRAYYILVVSPVNKEGSCIGYERLGVASVRKAHIAIDDGNVPAILL